MKKLLSFVMALVMLLGIAAVSQASSPNVDDLTKVIDIQPDPNGTVEEVVTTGAAATVATETTGTATATGGTRRAANYRLGDYGVPLAGVSLNTVANTPEVTNLINKMQDFLQLGSPVFEFFPDNVKQSIVGKLPAGFDASTLEVNELVTMGLEGVTNNVGDVVVDMQFATAYREGQTVVPVVGTFNAQGEVSEWDVLDGKVGANSVVQASFSQNLLSKLNGKTFAMAVLSEP